LQRTRTNYLYMWSWTKCLYQSTHHNAVQILITSPYPKKSSGPAIYGHLVRW